MRSRSGLCRWLGSSALKVLLDIVFDAEKHTAPGRRRLCNRLHSRASQRRMRTMTTRVEGPLKREITVDGTDDTLTITPQGMTLALKGRRKGLDLEWSALV